MLQQTPAPRDVDSPSGLSRKTYTVAEAAVLLGISRAKAYRCVRSGELHALQFGRRIVVPARVIDDLLEGGPLCEPHSA